MKRYLKFPRFDLKRNKIQTRDFRVIATEGVAATCLILLLPFSVNNFYQGRILLGTVSLIIILMLTCSAYLIRKGYFLSSLNFAFFIFTLFFLYKAIELQGVIGLLWCYTAVPAIYFLLYEKQSWIMNFCILALGIPKAFGLFENEVAIRYAASLIGTSAFVAIFFRIIAQQQAKLAIAEERRREAMASISHELRTPLYTMMVQAEAMLDGVRPLNRENLLPLSGSIDQLKGLVDDLYQLALADVNALTCDISDTDLVTLIKQASGAAKAKLAERNISLAYQGADSIHLLADAKRLRQILDNILENAYRYVKTDGHVNISALTKGENAILTICDNGPGVDDESLKTLFDRFFREESSRNRATGGAGLGLSIVKSLIQIHHGTVTAFHSPEGGLGIKITLPLADKSLIEEV